MKKHKGYTTPDMLEYVYSFATTVEMAQQIARDANNFKVTRKGKFVVGSFTVAHIPEHAPAVIGTLAPQPIKRAK